MTDGLTLAGESLSLARHALNEVVNGLSPEALPPDAHKTISAATRLMAVMRTHPEVVLTKADCRVVGISLDAVTRLIPDPELSTRLGASRAEVEQLLREIERACGDQQSETGPV